MILNRTRKASERYRLVPGKMGCSGEPAWHPNHHWMVVAGVDRGRGYRAYLSVSYAAECDFVPEEARERLRELLRRCTPKA